MKFLVYCRLNLCKKQAGFVVLAQLPFCHRQEQLLIIERVKSRPWRPRIDVDGLFESLCRTFIITGPVERCAHYIKTKMALVSRVIREELFGTLHQPTHVVKRIGSQTKGPYRSRICDYIGAADWQID